MKNLKMTKRNNMSLPGIKKDFGLFYTCKLVFLILFMLIFPCCAKEKKKPVVQEIQVKQEMEVTERADTGSLLEAEARGVRMFSKAQEYKRKLFLRKATDTLRHLIPVAVEAKGKTDPALASVLNEMGEVIAKRREFIEAELVFLRGMRIEELNHGRSSPMLGDLINQRMEMYRRAAIYSPLAEELAQRGYKNDLMTRPDDVYALARDLNDLAHIYTYRRLWKQGEKYALE
ncbi:MAG: hypothetical protein J7M18_00855, partial [Candidatus Eremiobacteraeota bacterium]|nr:hypothetical protein [Candidatus Eremiobacteraeota bacterium]